MFESNRREFIRALVGGAAGLTINSTVFGQAGSTPTPITATKLTDRLVVLARAGGNVALVVGARGHARQIQNGADASRRCVVELTTALSSSSSER